MNDPLHQDPLIRRADLCRRIRDFFEQRRVLEVSTPLITSSGVTDVHVESLALADGGFLRTSPEYAHKRLLAGGCGDLYELGPVFRAGERGRRHRPEFWMLEWYRLGWSWAQLADEVVELVRACRPERQWTRVDSSWNELAEAAMGFDALEAADDQLQSALDDAPDGLDRSGALDWLFATRIQPSLPAGQITVVYHFPACQAALARLAPEDHRVAERFEVFAGPLELANGYRELTDAAEQRRRFELDNARRAGLGMREMPLDDRFLDALESGLPDCAGVAMGVERLLMAVHDLESIDQALALPDEPH